MKVLNFTLSILLALVVLSACSNLTSTPTQTGILSAKQLATNKQLVSIAIAVVNDIMGSYRINPESLNFNTFQDATPSCSGRVMLGYTHIEEDSYTIFALWAYHSLNNRNSPKRGEKNPWIESDINLSYYGYTDGLFNSN